VALRDLGFGMIVSLLTEGEVVELELREAQALCQDLGLQFWSYPIQDRTVPADRTSFGGFTDQVFERISLQGGRAYCHCRAGLGRAPLLGCSLLVRGGLTSSDGWTLLSAKRGQLVPETTEQREWVQPPGADDPG
jgi:protein-tyrosine phosphatase